MRERCKRKTTTSIRRSTDNRRERHVNKMRRTIAGVGMVLGLLSLTGSALADTTITASVGPVTIPGVPVEICVVQADVPGGANECVETPEALTVALQVVVQVPTPEPDVALPTITPAQCPAGTEGVALSINTGGVDAVIGGSVTIMLIVDGMVVTQTIPIDQVVVGPNQTVTVLACAGVQPGVPVPDLPVPDLL